VRDAELARLERALRRSQDFRVFTVAVDHPRGAGEVLAALGARGYPHYRVHFDHSARLDLSLFSDLLAEQLLAPLIDEGRVGSEAAFVALDLSNAAPSDEAAWAWLFEQLNQRRNRIAATLRRPLILMAAPLTLQWFAASSPDVRSVVSAHFECTVHEGPVPLRRDAARVASAREIEGLLREAAALTARAHAGEGGAALDDLRRAVALRAAASEAAPHDPTLREQAVRASNESASWAERAGPTADDVARAERAVGLAASAGGGLLAEAWRALAALHERRGDATRAARCRTHASDAEPQDPVSRTFPAPVAIAQEPPAPNGPYRREAYVTRGPLEQALVGDLAREGAPLLLVGFHGCGKSWLLEHALSCSPLRARRLHMTLDAGLLDADAVLDDVAARAAAATRVSPRTPRERLHEWVERSLEAALEVGRLALTFDADIAALSAPGWHALEGTFRAWTERRTWAPWDRLTLVLCASGHPSAMRAVMRSSTFTEAVEVDALGDVEMREVIARFGRSPDDDRVRAVVAATGGDVGPLVACLHAMILDGLTPHEAVDTTRNTSLALTLAPLRRWVDTPDRSRVLAAVTTNPGLQLQGDARAVALELAAVGLLEERGGWRLRRGIYTALLSPESAP